MEPRLRVGVIGCGAIVTAVHLRVLRGMPGVRVTAIADPLSDARDRARRMVPQAAALADAGSLLARDDVDAVVVAVPSGLHAGLALAALQRGRHLYLEKPIASALEQGQQLAAVARTANSVTMIGFNWRFQPLIARARELIRGGVIGKVHTVSSEFSEPAAVPDWKARRDQGGGVLLDLGSHHFDLARWLLGEEVCRTEATIRSEATEHDSASVRLHFAGGCVASSVFSLRADRADWIELTGDRGALRVDRYARSLVVRGAHARTMTIPILAWRARALIRPQTEPSWKYAFHAFVRRIRGHDVELPTFDDGLRSLEIVADCERAAGVD
jgi:myo-inositol 2-dehydrogenase / D-chiro-inositol 1-dehydrogenase